MNTAVIMTLMALSLFTGGSAIGLRAAQERKPDPNDIAVQNGLSHLLIGLFGWAAVVCAFLAGLFLLGVIRTVVIAIPLTLFIAFTHFGDRIRPFYRFQLPLALAGLLLAIALWLVLISQITKLQGVPYG